ncbi:hypothetical protein PW52_02485 [Tamlana sedimentorum]|uniref:Lipoprotein n=1 Tax=Neotamlana sedimentorum TaxID=1435349 RepID=A0A0D7WCV6_9FLAO|nr:hypothetical protein [Tamlana sedimentorum]KJD36538.1 hypothetical protein PW52_02485 [Tamlana sedimentorum]
MKINFKGFIILTVLLVFLSCKKESETTEVTQEEKEKHVHLVTEQEVAKLKYVDFVLDSKTENAIKDWKPYFELLNVISEVKLGDLGFFIAEENEVDLLLKNLDKSIPDAVNSPSITARILVLKTTMLKLKSLANLDNTNRDELLLAIKEYLTAFSNVNFQMNKKIEFDVREIERP